MWKALDRFSVRSTVAGDDGSSMLSALRFEQDGIDPGEDTVPTARLRELLVQVVDLQPCIGEGEPQSGVHSEQSD